MVLVSVLGTINFSWLKRVDINLKNLVKLAQAGRRALAALEQKERNGPEVLGAPRDARSKCQPQKHVHGRVHLLGKLVDRKQARKKRSHQLVDCGRGQQLTVVRVDSGANGSERLFQQGIDAAVKFRHPTPQPGQQSKRVAHLPIGRSANGVAHRLIDLNERIRPPLRSKLYRLPVQ